MGQTSSHKHTSSHKPTSSHKQTPSSKLASSSTLTSSNNQDPDVQEIDGVKIEVVQGDITEENTDAIINPTDNKFSLGGAISKKIFEKGGQQIVNDCAKLGPLKTVAMTQATGQLKCKQLVHVLSPQNISDCQTLLAELLLVVENQGLHSLSIPLIGTGGSNLPRDQMASRISDVAVAAIRLGYIKNLKLIRLIGFTAAEKALFKSALNQSITYDFSTYQSPSEEESPPNLVTDAADSPTGTPLSPSPPSDSIPPPTPIAPAANPQIFAPHTSTVSTKINKVYFEVALGDLTDEQTDAIVDPTDGQLKLEGSLSKAIVLKGGSIINEECRTSGSIPAGGTVVTTGGALPCRHVVHVVSPGDLQECQRTVRAVLQAAVANKFTSLSFPPIGGGGKGLPLDPVACCIVDTLADAANQNDTGSLTLVRLVGFSSPEEDAFEAALTQVMQGKRNVKSAPSNSRINLDNTPNPTLSQAITPASHTPSDCYVINGVSIKVVLGDVTDEATDAIVNPTDEKMEFTGNLSKAILAKGGQSIEKECKAIGELKDVVLTSAGSLNCQHIVHVLSPGNATECTKGVRSIIRLCASKNFRSIAIPLIGASRGQPLEQVAGCITDEVANAARSGTLGTLTHVRLVGFNQKEKNAFEDALKLSAANSSMKVLSPSHSQPPIQSSTNGSVINGVLVEVLQGDITIESTEAIVNPTSENLELAGQLSKALVAKGGASIFQECKSIGKLKDVAITSAGSGSLLCHHIIHILSPGNINECQQVLRTLLSTVASRKFNSIAIPPIGVSRGIPLQQVAGCITDELGSAARKKTLGVLQHVRLVGYSQSEKDAFDRALKLSAAHTSALDAAKSGSTTSGAVQVTGANIALAVNLPATWSPMNKNQNWDQIPIKQSDADYAEALKLFTLSGKTPQKIYRIQNPTLYVQYQLEKTNMEKKYVGKWRFKSGMERSLYHGTEEAIVPKLCDKGFDRSYCGKNAVCFGRGSYFARDMSYSAQDKYSKPNPVTGQKFIFAVRVLIGVYQKGKDDQQVPDNQPSGEPYDATVDDVDKPTIFVIYRDQRAYPEFLYVFT